MSSAIIYKSSVDAATNLSPLSRIIVNGLALFAAYSVNFIACDLLYHDFNLQQSLKGSYWFILGPVLYVFGPGLAWVEAWLKSVVQNKKEAIKEKIEEGLKSIDPFGLFVLPSYIFKETLFNEQAIQNQRENILYLKEINRIEKG
jgi:uncharacterized membrane protein (GlpM family)